MTIELSDDRARRIRDYLRKAIRVEIETAPGSELAAENASQLRVDANAIDEQLNDV